MEIQKIQLKKISCSSCGAEITFDPGTQMTNCNFCGSKFQIEAAIDSRINKPDGILPFKIAQKQYENSVFEWLSEGDYTPDDILNTTVFESVNGVYLPMWFYKVRYHGNWSASSGYDRIEEYSEWSESEKKTIRKTRTVIDWRPSSGQCNGDISILAFAGVGKGIKSDIAIYSHGTTFARGELKNYDPKYTMGFNILNFTTDENSTWDSLGKIQADSKVEIDAKLRIPGDRYKDFYCDVIYDQEKPLSVYVPFWITYYKYKETEYYVYMDGTTTSRIEGLRPEDQARKDLIKYLKLKIWIFGILGGFLSGAFVYEKYIQEPEKNLFFGIITIIGVLVVTYIIQKFKVNKILNESKFRRKEILNKLRN